MAAGLIVGCGADDDDSQDAEASSPTSEPPSDPATAAVEETPPVSEQTATAVTSPDTPLPLERGEWAQLTINGPSPAARRDHSLATDPSGELLYLFGGRGSDGALSDLWVLDVTAQAWTQLAEGPQARFGHSAFVDPNCGTMLLFGGEGSGFFNDLWEYDISGDNWSQLTAAGGPSPRYGHGGFYDPGSASFYVTHGFTNSGRFDDTWAYGVDGSTWTDLSPADGERPIERCLMKCAWDGEALYLFGGQTDGQSFLGDLWALDLAGGGWTQLDVARPSPRKFYSWSEVHDTGMFLLHGGQTEGGESGETWLFNTFERAWSQLATSGPAPARNGHDAVYSGRRGSLIVVAGRNPDLQQDVWELALT